jgi:hypothetical protein
MEMRQTSGIWSIFIYPKTIPKKLKWLFLYMGVFGRKEVKASYLSR